MASEHFRVNRHPKKRHSPYGGAVASGGHTAFNWCDGIALLSPTLYEKLDVWKARITPERKNETKKGEKDYIP